MTELAQNPNTSLSVQAARNLANTTNTAPQMGAITPRWLMRLLPWVDVETGTYRVNRVRVIGEEYERLQIPVDEGRAQLTGESLRQLPLFRDVSSETARRLAASFESIQVPARSTVMNEGEPGATFYLIASGKLEVTAKAPSGGRLSLGVLRDGDYFGEIALMRSRPRSATVTALTPATLLVLGKDSFERLVAEDPAVRRALDNAAEQRLLARAEQSVSLSTAKEHEEEIPPTFVDYDLTPREYGLTVVQSILRVHTRVADLYSHPMDQTREQLRLTVEAIKERQEWEVINNEDFGLLRQVSPSHRITTRSGPPTPDDLDELLSRVWKEPAFFLAHPRAIAAFGRECTKRGVPPPTTNIMGSPFITWRGVPLVPSDKVAIGGPEANLSTSILLMRVGEHRQGVIGLHNSKLGDPRTPSLVTRYCGVDERGVASYLVSLYFAAAVLADDALAVLENVEVGHFHDR